MGMEKEPNKKETQPTGNTQPGFIPPNYQQQPYYFNTYGAFAVPVIYPMANSVQLPFNAAVSSVSQGLPPAVKALPGGIPPWRNPSRPQGRVSMQLPAPVPVVPTAPKPTNQPTENKNQQWPPSLKAYVDRCFLACKTDSQKDLMEDYLRKRINACIQSNSIDKINWSLEAIPFSVSSAPRIQPKQDSEEVARKKARLDRFKDMAVATTTKKQANKSFKGGEAAELHGAPIVGTCKNLEKQYLRLTAPPDPASVRPLEVLRNSLTMVLEKYSSGKDYHYLCDQLKSIRQDITVQNIRDDFAVRVYEAHARIAVHNGDFGEYNQCQTQLKVLYENGFIGNESEFTSYRLLYLLITENLVDLNNELKCLSEEIRTSPDVCIALKIHLCIATADIVGLLQACQQVQNFGQYIIQSLISKSRLRLIDDLFRAVKPGASSEFIAKMVGLNTDQYQELLQQIGRV